MFDNIGKRAQPRRVLPVAFGLTQAPGGDGGIGAGRARADQDVAGEGFDIV